MMRFFLVAIIVLHANSLHAQNAKIDSLNALLPMSQSVDRIDVLAELAKQFADEDDQVSFTFGMESFKMAVQAGDSLRIVRAGIRVSRALRKLEKYDSAIIIGSYCEGIIYQSKEIEDLYGSYVFSGLGLSYLLISKYDQALSRLFKGIAIDEKQADTLSITIGLNNIGLIYYKLKDYRLALTYYEKSLKLKKLVGIDYGLDILLVNISICNAFLNNLEEARMVLEPMIDKCPSECSDFTFVSALYSSGVIWYKSDNLQKAEKDFLKSYSLAKEAEFHRFVLDNIIYLSKIYLKLGDVLKAEQFLGEGEEMANKTLLQLEEMKIYEELSALYKAKGDNRKLSFYQTKYIQKNDSIYNQNQTGNLMQLHAEATEKEYKTQFASQEKMMGLKDEIINKQLGINLLIGFALILLAIVVYVLIRILNDRKLANTLLIKKVNERTSELERNHKEILSAIKHRDNALAQWENTIALSVTSIRDLCSVATSAELDTDDQRYFTEIDGITKKVSDSLDSILLKSKLDVTS